MDTVVGLINNILWGYVLIYGLLAVGVFFTVRLGFIQFRHFREMFRVIRGANSTDAAGITPFQALTVSLASRVGTGNLGGVAVALYLGGPGAIFWMWIVALVGMATAYAESTLGQLYKVTNANGQYRGGPAFYIAHGLGSKPAAMLFSVALILSFGLVFNAVQSNAIADAVEGAFDLHPGVTGIAIAAVAGAVIFGGIQRIARFAALVVPVVAIVYVALGLVILALNITEVPAVLASIITNAFGLGQAAGGVTGGLAAAMLNGVKRGLFSNEAGMGSVPNIAACATPRPHHPSSQGFVQALGVFVDTVVICTVTAVVILLSGVYEPGSGPNAMALTQAALEDHLGAFGTYFTAVAIFFFAFTSIVGNYAYAENALTYTGYANRLGLNLLRAALLTMVVWGALQSATTVFDAADASMGIMATINLVAIVLLSGQVVRLTRDYFGQRRTGQEPRFRASEYPELEPGIDRSIWRE